MIITKLIGGLGNQMFQYAIARSLSIKKQTEFKMDISGFDLLDAKYTRREYELNCLNIIENFADIKDVQRFKERKPLPSRFFRKVFPPKPEDTYHYYHEKENFNYDPEVFKLEGNIYLTGHWQTEKYFKDIEDVIRNDFTVKTEPREKNKELLNKIKNCNSVAVHVRRGDYVNNPIHSGVHGTCSLAYYKKCIDIIAERIPNPYFFIFSDEPRWTKENLKIDFPTTHISHNGPGKGYEDLRLMSNCKHFIIANSSFGWWGAWLSTNSNKMVLAPKRWFKQEGKDTKDLIPEGWIRI